MAKDYANRSTGQSDTQQATVQDVVADAITTLAGISEALAYRTAVYRDEMLELLARDADAQAAALRELVEGE